MDVELFERDEALERLAGLRARVRAGNGGAAMFLRGGPGSGKSALLEWTAATGGVEIVRARGVAGERELRLAFVEQLCGPVGAAAGGSAHAALHEALRAWADRGPALLLLDDLQWADADSLELIGFLARRLARVPVAMVATVRRWPPEGAALVETLVHEGVAEAIDLAPLSEAATGPAAWSLTRGNPLLVHELGRVVADGGALGDEQVRRTLLQSWMAGLPRAALVAAEAAAVLGEPPRPVVPSADAGAAAPLALPIRLTVLRAVAELTPAAFATAVDALVGARVLEFQDDGRAVFAHELLAAAIRAELAPARRALLHARAFERLRAQGDAVGAAPHALAAGMSGDAEAVATVAEAARRRLSGGDVEGGLELHAQAVALAEPAPSDELLAAQADAFFAAGRPADAIPVFARLLGRPLPPAVRAETLLRAARAQAYTGRFEDARTTYDDLLADARRDGSLGTGLLLERTHVVWELGGPDAGVDALAGAEEHARDDDERALIAAARATYRLQGGDPSGMPDVDRLAAAERRRLATPAADPAASFNAFLMHAASCAMTERFEDAAASIEHGTAVLAAAGAARAAGPLRLTGTGMLLLRGFPRDALADLERIGRELDVDPLMVPYARMMRARALLGVGETDAAEAAVAEARAQPSAGSFVLRVSLRWLDGELLLARDRAAEAALAFADVAALAREVGLAEPCTVPWAAGAIEAALAAGDPALAERVAAWLEASSESLSCVWPRAVALGGRAGLAAHRGDDELAERLYAEALALPTPAALDRARVLLRYGGWLRRRNQPSRARAPLAEALRVAEERGATPLAARARDELAASGGRRRRRRDDDDALTPQELRVARIAATGATTREIALELHVSPRTIETHLSHLYLKLGVASKHELRRRRAELGLEPAPATEPATAER